MGYHRAGFKVIGVDNKPQPNYPFTFIQMDVFEYLKSYNTWDIIHASPPCQHYSTINRGFHKNTESHPDLISDTREAIGYFPYIIENVVGSPLINPIRLCGKPLGLGTEGLTLRRHRLFESNLELVGTPCKHSHNEFTIGVYGHGPGPKSRKRYHRYITNKDCENAMGIDWMKRSELVQAIPPAYTEYLGKQVYVRLMETMGKEGSQ